MEIALSRCIALVVATAGIAAGAAWALRGSLVERDREERLGASLVRPGGSVLGRFARRACEAVAYAGPETRLYSDRPYHTAEKVPVLEGQQFCRDKRHGRGLWILDVHEPTALYTIATARHELERSGWRLYPEPVRVEAAGLTLDRLYRLRVEPGRYAIHHGHATTANPVFWNPRDARIVPVSPADG